MANESSKTQVFDPSPFYPTEVDIDTYLENVKKHWPILQDAEKERFCTIISERLHSQENVAVFLDVLKCYFASDGTWNANRLREQSSESSSFRFSTTCFVANCNPTCRSPSSEGAYFFVR